MAKFAKTIESLEELQTSQQGRLDKAEAEGNDEKVNLYTPRVKALATAIKVLYRRRDVLLGNE